MNHTKLPDFWFRKPDEWDENIMRTFPYVVELRRANLGKHYEITLEILESGNKENVAWRGPTFYFKNDADAVLFKLRYG